MINNNKYQKSRDNMNIDGFVDEFEGNKIVNKIFFNIFII